MEAKWAFIDMDALPQFQSKPRLHIEPYRLEVKTRKLLKEYIVHRSHTAIPLVPARMYFFVPLNRSDIYAAIPPAPAAINLTTHNTSRFHPPQPDTTK